MDKVVEQLNQLKNIKPRKDWVKAHRELLLSQITMQSEAKPQSFVINGWYLMKSLMPTSLLRFVARPIGALTIIALFIFSTGIFGVSASRGSLPGDFLYPVKLTSEKVKSGFTTSANEQTTLHLEFASERANEINQVAKKDIEADKKAEKVKVAVDGLKQEMKKAQETLDKVKDEPVKKNSDIMATMKKVDEKLEQINQQMVVNKQEFINGSSALVKSLEEVEEATAKTSVKVVEVIVDKHEKGEVELSDKQISETMAKIEQNIEKIKVSVEQTKVAVDEVAKSVENVVKDKEVVDESLDNIKITDENKDSETSDNLNVIECQKDVDNNCVVEPEIVVQKLQSKSGEATLILIEAKDFLNHGDLKSALEKIKQSTEMNNETIENVKTINETLEENVENDIKEEVLDTNNIEN